MSDKKPLSERQQSMLDFIYQYFTEHSRPPTIREIGRNVDISSTSVVNYNLTKLKEKGYLGRDAEVSRGLSLTDKAKALFENVVEAVNETLGHVVKIPMLGNIVAGEPLESVVGEFMTYDEDDAIELSASMVSGNVEELFALRVSGDSMIDAMVNDGDIVVMKRQNTARNGDMVAAWISDDTMTLKHFYHEGHRIRLQPANPTMEPIYVSPENVEVQGKVMMVLRQNP